MTSDSTHTEALLPCEHCGCRFGYHEAGCAALIDDIVSVAVTGFKADVERIMAEHPETKPGDMTREQQCMMVAEASGWRARALKAEAEIARRTPPSTTDAGEREAVEYATRLAIALHAKHFAESAPDWKPQPDLMTLLMQIDNLTAGMVPSGILHDGFATGETATEREGVARAVSQHTYAVAVGDEDCSDWPEMSERAQNVYREAADAALSALAPYRTTELATEYARGLADGVKQSEAAIVAWLRSLPHYANLANQIERREHAQEAGE